MVHLAVPRPSAAVRGRARVRRPVLTRHSSCSVHACSRLSPGGRDLLGRVLSADFADAGLAVRADGVSISVLRRGDDPPSSRHHHEAHRRAAVTGVNLLTVTLYTHAPEV